MPQNRITDLKCKRTSKEACLSHNHTQGYLLVNIFIVVFPFKIYSRQKKENKDNGPGRNAQFVLVYSTEILLWMGVVLLVSAISEGKKDVALLKFWGEVWVSTLVQLDRVCYRCDASGLEWSSSHHGIHLLLALVPDLEEAVPGPCCHSHAIISHPQAADTVVMPS